MSAISSSDAAVGQHGDVRDASGNSQLREYDTRQSSPRQGPRYGLVQDGVWYKRVDKRFHFLWKWEGWAIDVEELPRAEAIGVHTLRWHDTAYEHTYETTPQMFREHGIHIDEGAGPQIVLPVAYWSVDGKPPTMTPPESPARSATAAPVQLALSL